MRFSQVDALSRRVARRSGIVVCSLFLHHLDERDAIPSLRRMTAAARHMVLVNDLVRSRGILMLVAAAARLCTRSPVVWIDASRSVRAAFTVGEMRQLAHAAGMHDFRLARQWSCRMLLEWSRP